MIALGDPKWKKLKGGYRTPYDPSPVLRRLEKGENVWDILWDKLHHQGSVGEASYAAVPHLVRIAKGSRSRDWNIYGLVSTIEVERHAKKNPLLPRWLTKDYKAAWSQLLDLALNDLHEDWDPATIRVVLGVVALAKGALKVGALLVNSDASEIDEILDEYDGWSKFYK